MMEIFPEKIVKTRDSNGTSYTSEIYSLEGWSNLGFIGIIFALIVMGIFFPILSIGIFFVYLLDIKHKPILLNVVGMLVSIYLLLDFTKGWIISMMISLFYDMKEMIYVKNINGAMIFTHFFFLIFGGALSKMINNKLTLFLISLMVFTISYYGANYIRLNVK